MPEFIFLNINVADGADRVSLMAENISDGSLCRNCAYAHLERGFNSGEEAIFCTVGNVLRTLAFVVRDCSDFVKNSEKAAAPVGFAAHCK
ncbi:MAG: hypothetical protein AB7O65_02160 [Candidatus Korobacteraceae bacterium]